MNKITVSSAILTLNSGKTLRHCLQSVKDFDDVYILDGNSTDDTLAIAKEFNIPVYKQYDTEEKNISIKNFTELRTKADGLSKYDWIFLLDSDEYVSKELVHDVRRILEGNPDVKTMYFALKKMVLGDKVIEHTFNDSPYVARLYAMQSGISWKASKTVHEKLYVPDDVTVVKLHHAAYSHGEPTYREAVKKDDYYLSLVRQKMFLKNKVGKSKKRIIFSIIKNMLRTGNILYKSLKVYARHGFKESLPIVHVWRYMRYHVIISYYRFRELFI